jgi:hypothetical protein
MGRSVVDRSLQAAAARSLLRAADTRYAELHAILIP